MIKETININNENYMLMTDRIECLLSDKEQEVTNIKPVTMSKHKLSKDEFIRKVNQTYGDDSKVIKDLQQLEQDVMADIITTIKK